ncbi:SARP family transcriptional regulator [Deinococcus altitudinis]|uniref:SARP family transcriptional regulator n=1 Tax=Deinococcus altitudinis TaxID=468914 RepID=UPI003892AF81
MKIHEARHIIAADALEVGQYTTVITLLNDPLPLAAVEWRLLGLAYLRSGQLLEAETPLLRASTLGDPEGQVEYGNLLRASGKFDDALKHFEGISPSLTGELQLRCLRWWGTAEFQQGLTGAGLARCERAWYGYLAMGDDVLTGKITQTLAQMHLMIGNRKRAKYLYEESLSLITQNHNNQTRATALRGLTAIQLEEKDYSEAEKSIKALRDVPLDSDIDKAKLLTLEAEYFNLVGQNLYYNEALEELRLVVHDLQDYELRSWTAIRLADLYSLQGKHSKALEVLHDLSPTPELPPALLATRGILMRRRGHLSLAVQDLQAAIDELRGKDARMLLRSQLHLSDALRRSGQEDESGRVLREALTLLMQDRQRGSYKPDLEELRELTQHAMLDPESAPYMEAVLDQLAILTNTQPIYEDTLMHLQVFTLGRAVVMKDGEEVALTLQGSALTLAYLTLHPNRTRAEIQADLYPDKEPETGASYFRSVFRELRQKFGQHILIMEGPHKQPRYRMGRGVHVDLDAKELQEALRRGEVARALALYRGPFLQHMDESEWANALRDELGTGLGLELRGRLNRAVAAGDLKRGLLLCNQYLRVDPHEQEILELRVELARKVGAPHELARYMVELQRFLN